MCLLIFKPAERTIPEEYLKSGWQSNSDGAGFAYVKGGKVVIEKGLMSLKEFLAELEKAQKENKKSPFVVHLRSRTAGDKSIMNTQPFEINGGAFAHNGNFPGSGSGFYDGPSDSAKFAERYKNDMGYDFITKHKDRFETVIGYNKIVLLYDDGKRIIVNEKEGVWENDIWYSNTYFRRSFGGEHINRMLG